MRRVGFVALCLALAACSTASSLESRPLQAGVSRAFAADFARTAAAVDAAIETLPVNRIAAYDAREGRVERFERPVSQTGWGESGRVVVSPIDARTTRVTVAVNSRDPVQLPADTEGGYASRIFTEVQAVLSSQ